MWRTTRSKERGRLSHDMMDRSFLRVRESSHIDACCMTVENWNFVFSESLRVVCEQAEV